MNRLLDMGLVAAAAILLGACSVGASAGSPSSSPSPNARTAGRNGTAGELVRISGTTLVVNTTTGDVTVVYTDSTTFQRTSTGTFADIVTGTCLLATGQKDATGTVTAATVRLSDKVSGSCQVGPGGGGGRLQGTPPPGAGASPPANQPGRPNFSFVAGEVTTVAGTSITVKNAAGTAQTVNVPTTVRVSKSAPAAASDLALHQCVTAAGSKDASGKVTARAISIVPAGPSGCSAGRGFFGGGGGRGVPGGGGGGFGGGG